MRRISELRAAPRIKPHHAHKLDADLDADSPRADRIAGVIEVDLHLNRDAFILACSQFAGQVVPDMIQAYDRFRTHKYWRLTTPPAHCKASIPQGTTHGPCRRKPTHCYIGYSMRKGIGIPVAYYRCRRHPMNKDAVAAPRTRAP